MRITVLSENTSVRDGVAAEHGLSLYIELAQRTILFDMGQGELFARNAEILGIDLSRVDLAVLSHGHYDHGGGLREFLRVNPSAPVYVSRRAFCDHRNAEDRYIGLEQSLADSPRLVLTDGAADLGEGLFLRPLEAPAAVGSGGLSVCSDGRLLPDTFLHEQSLIIREGSRKILFSGCSHTGTANIVGSFRPDVFVGGLHLFMLDPLSDRERIEQTAKALADTPTEFYTCHCTGREQYAVLKAVMGERLHLLSGGMTVEL